MAFTLPALPFDSTALEPYMSARTLEFHHGKHHQTYITNLNGLVKDTPFESAPLEKIIQETAGDPERAGLFNNAAQTWNHSFFWQSLKPRGGGEPTGILADKINASFGGTAQFKEQFKQAALTQFGSGWAWLVQAGDALKIVKTSNAQTPLTEGLVPLLTFDVWEHAYYLDYQNRRADAVQAFLDHLANWDFATANLRG